jgi:phosphomannomutase
MKFIFDVDGTLTESRQRIDPEFKNWFENFATHNAVYLVTGSDREKTLEQVGSTVYNLAIRVYNCSGSDVWEQDRNIYTKEFTISDELEASLINHLNESKFTPKTGKHIEKRPGLVNFSIVGRNASMENRFLYRQWDEHKKEREIIAQTLSRLYQDVNFQIAGETGIDITPKGADKSQILKEFDLKNDQIFFFGDKMEPGGNDYEIGFNLAISGHTVHQVKSWKDTWDHLKKILSN